MSSSYSSPASPAPKPTISIDIAATNAFASSSRKHHISSSPVTPKSSLTQSSYSTIHHSPRQQNLHQLLQQTPSPYSSPLSPQQTPSRKKQRQGSLVYGDRFIPMRNANNIQAAFSLAKEASLGNSNNQQQEQATPVVTELHHQKIQQANKIYSTLLKAELFGNDVPSTIPTPPSMITPSNSNSSLGELSVNDSFNYARTPSTQHHRRPSAATLSSSSSTSSFASSVSSASSSYHHPGVITPPRSIRSTNTTPSNGNIFQYKSPNRNSFSMSYYTRHNSDTSLESVMTTPEKTPYTPRRTSASDVLFPASSSSAAAHTTIDPTHPMYSTSPVRLESQKLLLSPTRAPRGISKIPYKVLDAPDLVDDFYLNLVDWGSQNVLGVGLGSKVYIWNAETSYVTNLCDLGTEEMVTSISWIKRGTHLAIGTRSGTVQIWDAEHQKLVRSMTGHDKRAGALAWNGHILTSGSRDRTILHRDVRIADHYIKRLTGHKQEVCGLKWNTEDNQLASGGNDNRLIVWDGMNEQQLYRFTDHKAAIKAIAWSPHTRGLLATGGGTADRRIRFWNTLTGTCLNEIDTGSQVCNLAWSKVSNELVSTHGYSQNQVVVWKYPTMQQVAVLTGHSYRVLYLAMSPDGRTIATGAGDETLRFWNIFDDAKNGKQQSSLLDVFPKLR